MKLTEQQKAFIEANWKKLKEKELFEELSKVGPEPDHKSFKEILKGMAAKAETEVFRQELSDTELSETSGGSCRYGASCGDPSNYEHAHCTQQWERDIYEGGFPNCAATVEDDSWCGQNDACYADAIDYQNMHECIKAWE